MKTIQVHLADAPTDVLVCLVDNGRLTAAQLVGHFAAIHGETATAKVHDALHLLEGCGYSTYDGSEWSATDSGTAAVAKARDAR